MPTTRYRGRFAPSPTGPLHAGSLVAALASWLDARAHGGCWLVRIEDLDTARCVPGTDEVILGQLAACGLVPDGEVVRQSARDALYRPAFDRLIASGRAYPCGCSRRDIEEALAAAGAAPARDRESAYPGTCRTGLHGRLARSWRFRLRISEGNTALQRASACFPAIDSGAEVAWNDRRLGLQQQDVATEVGDFVLKRADGPWAYQLAVVVDDADQGISDVVRGEDLADNTARQILLQRALGLPTPRYLHVPLVRAADGRKLSKQAGAAPLDVGAPLERLAEAGAVLGLRVAPGTVTGWLGAAVLQWRERWGP